jgi:exonuclease SbcD
LKILHTADWHVGRLIRGRSRADEHRAVLDEIAALAERERIDLVIVAGDLFDLAAPSPESEEIVYGALLALADGGAHVVLVAGNHDHARRFEAIRPLLARTGRLHAGAVLARPDQGGVLTLETRGGELARVALFPFLSQRGIVRAADLMGSEAADHSQAYAGRSAAIVRALCGAFRDDSVNLFVGHLLAGGAVGSGSERAAHMHDDYRIPPLAFDDARLDYVALGHVHARQKIHAGCPIWYCGAPLQLDFGESNNEPGVMLIEAHPGKPAEVDDTRRLAAGKRLMTIRGTLDSVEAEIHRAGDVYLRVEIDAPPRPGLADTVRSFDPDRVVEVRPAGAATPGAIASDQDAIDRLRRSPREIFAEYLAESGKDDPRLLAMFDQLLEEASATEAT